MASSTTSASGVSTSKSGGPVAATAGCDYLKLVPSIAAQQAGAGSQYLAIKLTNTGKSACNVTGYPGVSIVGHGNGTQIGNAATRDRSVSPARVVVAAGGSTTFTVQLTQAGNYPAATCTPTAGDGFRIYPPGSTKAVFLRDSVTGCAGTSVNLLSVRPTGTSLS